MKLNNLSFATVVNLQRPQRLIIRTSHKNKQIELISTSTQIWLGQYILLDLAENAIFLLSLMTFEDILRCIMNQKRMTS